MTGPSARGAAVAVVLYGPSGALRALCASSETVDGWLVALDPSPRDPDDAILELVRNADPTVDLAQAGPALLDEVARWWAAIPAGLADQLWGHSVIVQGELDDGADPRAVAEALRPYLADHVPDDEPLAWATLAHGWVWQSELPDGAGRAMYLALGAPGHDDRFVAALLARPGLLGVDEHMHRAFHQVREALRDGRRTSYVAALDEVRQHTDALLQAPPAVKADGRSLGHLIDLRDTLVQAQVELDALHRSVARQLHDLRVAAERAPELGPIGSLHHSVLRAAATDLALLVDEADRPLAAARAAIESVQALRTELAESRSWWLGVWISVVVTGFTAATIVDRPFWAAVLGWDGPLPAYLQARLLGVQLGVSTLAAVVLYVLLRVAVRVSIRPT